MSADEAKEYGLVDEVLHQDDKTDGKSENKKPEDKKSEDKK